MIKFMLTDAITHWSFTSSDVANASLHRADLPADCLFFGSNSMVDTLLSNLDWPHPPAFWAEAGLQAGRDFVVTLHRPANVDSPDGSARLLEALVESVLGMRVVCFRGTRARPRRRPRRLSNRSLCCKGTNALIGTNPAALNPSLDRLLCH